MSLFLVARLVSEYSKNSTQRYVYVEIFRISKKWINLRFVMCIFPNKFKIYLIEFINEICQLSNKQDRYCVLACFLNALDSLAGPAPSPRPRKACGRAGSEPRPSRPRCASFEIRWHRPRWSGARCGESPWRAACSLWDELHDLRKQSLAKVHKKPPRGLSFGNYTRLGKQVSNRHQKNGLLDHTSIGFLYKHTGLTGHYYCKIYL